MQFNPKFILFILCFAVGTGCKNNSNILQEVKPLPHYPSGSGIEYFNNQFCVIGDDASYLLVLDSNLNPLDSIVLYSFAEKRIPKAIKPDLEAITLLPDKKLLLTGSGSQPSRNIAWVVDPLNKQKDSIRLDTFYSRIALNGIKEVNIEGAAAIPGGFIFANRGSKGFPKIIWSSQKRIFGKDKPWLKLIPSLLVLTVTALHSAEFQALIILPKAIVY